jgi:hypothetical protein
MATALGISTKLGSRFCCVLHQEENPSAYLYQAKESGDWLYHDFHGRSRGGEEWLTLARVRAQLAGRNGALSAPEHATWKLILLVEAGLLPLVAVSARPLPEASEPVVSHVYERFLFLLGCRWNYTYGAPAPFTRDFAAALCGISERAARYAIDELIEIGALAAAGKEGRMRLWLPAPMGSEDHMREDGA